MEYVKDENNKDLLFDKESNYQVMMEWEKPYMEEVIERLNPKGHVLEIGFGLGYSANKIQSFDIKSHTIIENNPEVFKKLKEWSSKQKHKVNLVFGDWQDVLHSLGKFDSIFFDDAPSNKYLDLHQTRLYYFYYLILLNHASLGCRMSWYCDGPMYWLTHPETSFSMKEINIDIPNNANYISEFTKKNKILYAPLLIFKNGTTKDFIPMFFDNNYKIGFFEITKP